MINYEGSLHKPENLVAPAAQTGDAAGRQGFAEMDTQSDPCCNAHTCCFHPPAREK